LWTPPFKKKKINTSLSWDVFIINSVEQLQTLPKTQSKIDISPFLKTQKPSIVYSIILCGVYISQLIRYYRPCGSYQDFLDRGFQLTRKLLNQGFLLVKLKSSRKFYGRHYDLVEHYGISITNDQGYVPLVVNTSRSFPHAWLITGFVTRFTRLVSLVEQKLLTPPSFSGIRVTRSLVLYVCFEGRCLSFYPRSTRVWGKKGSSHVRPSVRHTFGFRIIISTAQPNLFKLSHIAVYHKIQVKFDYGVFHIYRSWVMTLFLLENRDFLGFWMIFKVWLNQIFSNFHTMLWTIKRRLTSITVYFTFTVPELCPFFSEKIGTF
jgi:hypothetical protein